MRGIVPTEAGVADPPQIVSQIDPAIVLGVFGALVTAAAIVAVVWAARLKDPLPVACCVGAMVCALNEPIYDILGKIVYASDHAMAFTAIGRDIPWFLVIGYLPLVGLLPYAISRMMAAGVSRARLHAIALGSCLSVVVIETFGTWFDAWAYYGEPPLKYLVVAPQMAPVPIVGGFLLYVVAHRFTGWRRAVSGFVISLLALPIVFASASWPLYFGLYTELPAPVDWALAAAMLALSAAMVVATTGLAERWRRLSGRADEHWARSTVDAAPLR